MKVKWTAVIIALGAILYLSAQAFTGADGLGVWVRVQQREAALQSRKADLQARQSALLSDIKRLRPDSLDLDYVESIARAQLGLVRPEEALIPLPQAILDPTNK